jgi:hypothetical protein
LGLRVPNHDAAQQEHEVSKHPIVPINIVAPFLRHIAPFLRHALVIRMAERCLHENREHFVNILDTNEFQLIFQVLE